MYKIINLIKKYSPLSIRIILRRCNWKLSYYFQSLFIKEKKYVCPIIEKEYKNFVKIGSQLISPDTGARNRHRFLWHYIKNNTTLISDHRKLLHISPEYSLYKTFVKHSRKNYFPVDKFEQGYDYLSRTKNFDLLHINEQNTYDYIICNHVLEHIVEDDLAIKNLYKLLENKGVAFVSVPILKDNLPTFEDYSIIKPEDRITHFGQWDHVRYYGLDIVDRFIKNGFNVKIIDSLQYFTREEQIKYGVPKQDFIFELRK